MTNAPTATAILTWDASLFQRSAHTQPNAESPTLAITPLERANQRSQLALLKEKTLVSPADMLQTLDASENQNVNHQTTAPSQPALSEPATTKLIFAMMEMHVPKILVDLMENVFTHLKFAIAHLVSLPLVTNLPDNVILPEDASEILNVTTTTLQPPISATRIWDAEIFSPLLLFLVTQFAMILMQSQFISINSNDENIN